MHYRTGELFFPMRVEEYVAKCSLHEWVGGNDHVLIIPPGELTIEALTQHISNVNFMVYADQEVYVHTPPPLLAHLVNFDDIIPEAIEALRKLSAKLTKGKLPKRIIETAHANYGGIAKNAPTYHYRTLSKQDYDGKYDVIQYWFFYAFNDWATTFDGVNDHEGDWEMIQLVFDNFTDDHPRYGVYAAHGKPFTRKWEELEKDPTGNHPLVYLQGGSHAAFPARNLGSFSYLLKRTFKKPLRIIENITEYIDAGGRIWDEGDVAIGVGGDHSWADPVNLLEQAWVPSYRGLWGTRYFVKKLGNREDVPKTGGAPAGPMFDTNGFVRAVWENPVKWGKL